MRELVRPPEVSTDPKATEMIRAWIAHNTLYVSLLLGMWKDAPELDVDEREAWGELLADIVQHIANGLKQSHGFAPDETIATIRSSFLSHLDDGNQEFSGAYLDNDDATH